MWVVLVSTILCVSLVDNPSISLGDQARVMEGVLNEREVLLDSCHCYDGVIVTCYNQVTRHGRKRKEKYFKYYILWKTKM